jgi:nitrite reductase/ring-hydroxylating ferredoxin subunit
MTLTMHATDSAGSETPAASALESAQRLGFTTDGWYSFCLSRALGKDDVLHRTFAGMELMAFRDRHARVHVASSHCPHLGTHLGFARGGFSSYAVSKRLGWRRLTRKQDGCIQCPFHHLRFDPETGAYRGGGSKRDPQRERRRLLFLESREINDRIWVWFSAEGRPPDWEIEASKEDPGRYGPLLSYTFRNRRVHEIDVQENGADSVHFGPTHDFIASIADNKLVLDANGKGYKAFYRIKHRQLSLWGRRVEYLTQTTPHLMGIGYAYVDVVLPTGIRARNAIVLTPIRDGLRDISVDVQLRRFDGLARLPSPVRSICLRLLDMLVLPPLTFVVLLGLIRTIIQDLPIWENKVWLRRPALTPFDGPIEQYRAWCGQFVPERYKPWFDARDEGRHD